MKRKERKEKKTKQNKTKEKKRKERERRKEGKKRWRAIQIYFQTNFMRNPCILTTFFINRKHRRKIIVKRIIYPKIIKIDSTIL